MIQDIKAYEGVFDDTFERTKIVTHVLMRGPARGGMLAIAVIKAPALSVI